jgi:hypothetical protein
MNTRTLSAALMAAAFLVAAPAFAQNAPAQKQPTQEGGSSFSPLPCGLPYNANPDPNCGGGNFKQHTQNLTPTSAMETAGKDK